MGALVEKIGRISGPALALQCDLTNSDSLRCAIEETVTLLGPIDCVFYNAGSYDNEHSSIEINEDVWRTTMDVNLNGALGLAKQTIPSMSTRDRGSFVFTSSAASLVQDKCASAIKWQKRA
jgi:NADP-dependent 3-hydroxy acid dehydrogenase YdfG